MWPSCPPLYLYKQQLQSLKQWSGSYQWHRYWESISMKLLRAVNLFTFTHRPIDIMELLSGLKRWHVRRLAPELHISISWLFFLPLSVNIYRISRCRINQRSIWGQNKSHKIKVPDVAIATSPSSVYLTVILFRQEKKRNLEITEHMRLRAQQCWISTTISCGRDG